MARILVADERQMVMAWEFEVLRAGNSFSHVTPFFNFQAQIVAAMNRSPTAGRRQFTE